MVVVFLLMIAISVGIYLLIENETESTQVMNRDSAEQSARTDSEEPINRR